MKNGQLDPSSLQRMLYDTLGQSDDIFLVLEQTTEDAADLGIASANDAFCRTSGYTHEDLIGRPFQTLVADDTGRSRWTGIVRTTQEEGTSRSELYCVRKDGTN